MSAVGAVIMAAGRSERLAPPPEASGLLPPGAAAEGFPKQLLPLGDRVLLQVTLDRFVASRLRPLVLVLGHDAERIARHLRLPRAGFRLAVNRGYARGLASSLRTGLDHLAPEEAAGGPAPRVSAAVFGLGDQPLVRSDTLDALAAEYRRSGARIVQPTHRGQPGNPVLFDGSLFPALRSLTGDAGARGLLRELRREILHLEVDDPGVLVDVDDWATYLEVRRRVAGETAG